MNKKIFILLLGFLILSGYNQKSENECSLVEVQINETNYYLTLPTGIKKNEVTTYEEGFYQQFTYTDNSFVVILRGGNAELDEPKSDNPKIYSRKQRVDRIIMVYGNVKPERKAEFDKAFDLMKENGILKK
jgi:hypothetical protein